MTKELKRVLYLEDEPHIAKVAMIAMQRFSDLEVLHCERGDAAVEAFGEFEPDLMVFDIMLPGMDGLQTYGEILNRYGIDRAPVVFMTAKAQTHEQERYMALGALGVIVKPFNAMSLGDHLKSLWASRELPLSA